MTLISAAGSRWFPFDGSCARIFRCAGPAVAGPALLAGLLSLFLSLVAAAPCEAQTTLQSVRFAVFSFLVGRGAKIVFRTILKNRGYQAYADAVPLSAKERALLILFPPFYPGSLEVQSRMLVDVPPASPTR